MPHQESLNIIADIDDRDVEPLERMLGTIREHGTHWHALSFAKLPRVHFAQLFVLDSAVAFDGVRLPAHVMLATSVDAPLADHLDELSTVCGEGVDAVFSRCTGYPAPADRSPATRRRFLESHSRRSTAEHINRRGRTVRQIREEDALRREINGFLDQSSFERESALEVRERIVAFVGGRPDLAWALGPPAPPAFGWRMRHRLHGLFSAALAVLLLPLLLLALPLFLLLLRRHEKRDIPDTSVAPASIVRALRDDEDYWVQNQMVAAGLVKPGVFRRTAMRIILLITDVATRHVYDRGTLSGLNTIHFARWVKLDGGRRMAFCSNYDGSLESYMNDFIDKAAWGLNLIFSNGDGFPATVYGIGKGITDEKAYKRYLPTRLVQTRVWYSAYPHLTTKNIANNEAIRRGLTERMTEAQARQWLDRFGAGRQLPESGWLARTIDGLPWHTICRKWN